MGVKMPSVAAKPSIDGIFATLSFFAVTILACSILNARVSALKSKDSYVTASVLEVR
jgi:hypothetical protein